jgi:uncharacterized damage-inducible protein DinB
MGTMREQTPLNYGQSLVEAFAVNERMNQYLLEQLPDEAWRAEPPGGKGRTIAAIAAHIHNVRHMWLTVSAKGSRIPEKLDRDKCSKKQAAAALAKSAEAMTKLFEGAVARPDGKVRDFRPDVVNFFGYVVAHEAHHRGQICMLTRQVGYPLPKEAGFGMWEWGKMWKELGFKRE